MILMVIDYFHFIGVVFFPFEADAPLIVDSDAVPAGFIPFKRFEMICRRDSKVVD